MIPSVMSRRNSLVSGSYGSRLAFDKAGLLYVALGDRNYGPKAQDPGSHIGKILRIRDDGTVPPDNPFVGRTGYPVAFALTAVVILVALAPAWRDRTAPRRPDS